MCKKEKEPSATFPLPTHSQAVYGSLVETCGPYSRDYMSECVQFYNKSIMVSFRHVKTKFPNGGFSIFLFIRVLAKRKSHPTEFLTGNPEDNMERKTGISAVFFIVNAIACYSMHTGYAA